MSEEIWTCPKCKQGYLMDNKETYSDGIAEFYRMTCSRCRHKGEVVLLENELGTRLRKEQEKKTDV